MQRKNSGRSANPDKVTGRNASATKSGPGRFHKAEHSKATPSKPPTAGRGFVLHTASIGKKNRKERIKSLGGIRQFKKWERTALAMES